MLAVEGLEGYLLVETQGPGYHAVLGPSETVRAAIPELDDEGKEDPP